ncbi:MAG TPA: site-2 protease family protein [Candidatus Nanoarchaeia archaeon]|nr:site-2 protease family protein [Candidatus Nanoarchaeia archaeon]
MMVYKKYKIGKFTISNVEIRDLVKAWLAVSIAFGIVLGGLLGFLKSIVISLIVVGTGFLLHELGHKVVAQRFKYTAEFRSFDEMLFLAVIMSFFGFVFAAPGAVMIGGRSIREDHNGKISIAGPLVNLMLAVVFMLVFYASAGFVQTVAEFGMKINGWLALFNLIPVWQFDGAKVYKWRKGLWLLVVGGALALLFQAELVKLL